MKYLEDTLEILGSAVPRGKLNVSGVVSLGKDSGLECTETYTLVTGGKARHDSVMSGVPLEALLERCGMAKDAADDTAITAYFKDGYTVCLRLGDIRSAEKPVMVAYECGGLPLIGPTGREAVYKRFGEADGYFRSVGNSGGPLRLVAEGRDEAESNAPGCGKWLAALAVGDPGDYTYRRECDPEPEEKRPEHVELPQGEKFLALRVCGREEQLGFEDMRELQSVSGLFAARDGRFNYEGVSLRTLIEDHMPAGAAFPRKIKVISDSGYEKEISADLVLDGVDSSYQPGERREVILAYASQGAPLVRSRDSAGYIGANDGAPLRLIVENSIALWIKSICRIEAE